MLLIISLGGESIPKYLLDNLVKECESDEYSHIGCPSGKYVLHPREQKKLIDEVFTFITKWTKSK